MKHLALALVAFLFYSCSTSDKKGEMKIDVDNNYDQNYILEVLTDFLHIFFCR